MLVYYKFFNDTNHINNNHFNDTNWRWNADINITILLKYSNINSILELLSVYAGKRSDK